MCPFSIYAEGKTPQTSISYDLWIKGGTIVDGLGKKPFKGDILIRNDTIEFLGTPPRNSAIKASHVIDAKDKMVTPGFIDIHTHFDGPSSENPEDIALANFLSMGVTTINIGQCGDSPAGTDDLRAWLEQIERQKPGVNLLTFVGHNTIREKTGVGLRKTPSTSELEAMKNLLRKGLDAGAFGLSFGLEYEPGKFSEKEEWLALAKVVGRKGSVMSHLRNEDDDRLESSMKEFLTLTQVTNAHISHLKSVYGKGEKRGQEILAILNNARKQGFRVTADTYPYTASATTINILFPDWVNSANVDEMKKSRREELLTYIRTKVTKRNGPAATLFTEIKKFPNFVGKTLDDLAKDLKRPFEEVIVDEIGFSGASAVYFVMDEELQDVIARDPNVAIGSDGSPRSKHPRAFGTFAKFIRHFVVEKNYLTLEEAVRKVTGLPSTILGLKDRGLLKERYKADILIFAPKNAKDRATYLSPQELATGFDYVILNGKIALRDGKIESRYGTVIKSDL